jgi:hypothetical protein
MLKSRQKRDIKQAIRGVGNSHSQMFNSRVLVIHLQHLKGAVSVRVPGVHPENGLKLPFERFQVHGLYIASIF